MLNCTMCVSACPILVTKSVCDTSVLYLICAVSVQVECGAQVIQIFDSWAHHLSEEQFEAFAKVGQGFKASSRIS